MDKVKPEEILNEDEIRASKDAFDAYDKMGYGTLEVEELQKVLEGTGGCSFEGRIHLIIKIIIRIWAKTYKRRII